MNKLITITLATLAVAGTALGFTGAAGAASTPTVNSTTVTTYQVKPATIVLTKADGGDSLRNLKWSAWTADYARATGIRHTNDCKPNCAAGTYHDTPVTVFLDKVNAANHFTGVSFGSVASRTFK